MFICHIMSSPTLRALVHLPANFTCLSRRTIGITWQTVFGLIGVDYYGLTTSQNGSALGVQAVAPVVMNLIYLPITRKSSLNLITALR